MLKKSGILICLFLVPTLLFAQQIKELIQKKEIPTPIEWETFFTGLEASKVHVWIENGWINIEHKNKNNELLWRTVLSKGSIKKKPIIEKDKGYFTITDASGKYYVKYVMNYQYQFIIGKLQDAVKEGAGGFSPEHYGLDFIQRQVESNSYSFFMWQKEKWQYQAIASNNLSKAIGIFRSKNTDLEEDMSESSWSNSHSHLGKYHYFWDGENIFAELPTDYRVNKLLGSVVHVDSAAPELKVSKWFNSDKRIILSELKGKLVLLYFWRSTCWPSTKQLAKLQYLSEKYKSQGLEIVTIHPDEKLHLLDKYLTENPEIKVSIGIDDSTFTRTSYGSNGEGNIFVIDRQGKILKAYLIVIPAEEKITELLKTRVGKLNK